MVAIVFLDYDVWFRLNLIRLLLSSAAMATLISAYYIVYLLWCSRPLIKVIVFVVERSVIKVRFIDVSFSRHGALFLHLFSNRFLIFQSFCFFCDEANLCVWTWRFVIMWRDVFYFLSSSQIFVDICYSLRILKNKFSFFLRRCNNNSIYVLRVLEPVLALYYKLNCSFY